MKNCWGVLKIEPTSERKAIKIAYTTLVKTLNPESHPEQFQELREAYEQALYLSQFDLTEVELAHHQDEDEQEPKASEQQTEEFVEPEISTESPKSQEKPEKNQEESQEPLDPTTQDVEEASTEDSIHTYAEQSYAEQSDPAESFMQAMSALWQDEKNKYNQTEWIKLTFREELFDLQAKQQLWYQVFDFFAHTFEPALIEQHAAALRNIVIEYNQIFHWSSDELKLQLYFDEEAISRVLYLVDANRHTLQKSSNNVNTNGSERKSGFFSTIFFFCIVLTLMAKFFSSISSDSQDTIPVRNVESSDKAIEYFEKAEDYYAKQRWDLAIDYYSKTLGISEYSTASLVGRSKAYFQSKNYEKAIEDFDKIIDLGVASDIKYDAYKMRSISYASLKNYSRALKDINKNIESGFAGEEEYGIRGQILAKLGRYDEALEDLNFSLQAGPNLNSIQMRAWIYSKLDNREKMCEDLQSLCELGNQPSCNNKRKYCSQR